MGFFHSRIGTNKNEVRSLDEDDDDFQSIFEIEDLISLDSGDIEEVPSNHVSDGIQTSPQYSTTAETARRDTGVEKSGGGSSDILPGDTITFEPFDLNLKDELKLAIVWNNKGVVLSRLGKYDEAIEAYDQALLIDPEYFNAWNNKGVVLSRLGKYDEAIEAYDQALMITPNYSAASVVHELKISAP